MFTGLVAGRRHGRVARGGAEGARLRIATALGAEIGLGDSVAVDGACLTATAADDARLRDRGDEPDPRA